MTGKIVTIVGARPQFIKAAMVSRALVDCDRIDEKIIHTGQHFDDDMSDVFFRELGLPEPHRNLGISGGTHGQMTGRMLEAIEQCLFEIRPDLVLVYGDTNSTLAGALAAAKIDIPVAHVEAGLRSFNRIMPEEINRIPTDELAALLFCPTEQSVTNLAREGITDGVFQVGDVMQDVVLWVRDVALKSSDILKRLALSPGGYCVCTIHRAENTADKARLTSLMEFVHKTAGDKPLVFPVHPRTRQAIDELGVDTPNFRFVDPLSYLDMQRLLSSAALLFTDSGGLQKEAYFHRISCITLREETEWVETIDAGWNRLWREGDFLSPRREIADYGSGDSAAKIVAHLRAHMGI